ncbi:MAG: hypothetical protein SFV22_12735 [Saprospiraceae bacterium]|nr:hypothetical protein [Saprospiraceae bacterium]
MTKKTGILLLGLILLFTKLSAQEATHVLHVSGQVQYYAQHGAKPALVKPGMSLGLSGKLRCKGAATAKLLYNGKTFVVSGGKMRNLSEIVKNGQNGSNMGFTGRFFDFLTESIKEGDNKEQLQKHHRRYMNKTSGGIKGYAKQEYAIAPLLVTSGNLPSANVIFKWRNIRGDGPYTFLLLAETGKPVAQILTRDTAITLDLDQLAISLDEEYQWSVTRGGGAAKSVGVPFYHNPQAVANSLANLTQDPAYQSASELEQQLMQAYALEENRCYFSADQIYARLLATDSENLLLRKTYATFLARMDMLPEANELFFQRK